MRLNWIDIVRGMCMYCVVLSHTEQVPLLYRCVFEPFFLTAFFFLSGVVFKNNPIKKSLLGSIIKILWPYFINSIIVTLGRITWIKLLCSGNIVGVKEYFLHWGSKILNGDVFWFLACLFIVQALAISIMAILKNKKHFISVAAVVCLTSIFFISGEKIAPWSANTAILALGYFLIGVVCRDMLLSLDLRKFRPYWGILAIGAYITIIVIIYLVSPWPIQFDIHTHKLSPELLYIFLSFAGVAAVCLFAMSLGTCKLLQILGMNSLLIYMYHGYGGLITNTLFDVLQINSLAQYNYIYSLLVSCTSTLITLGIAIIINKYFPILTGRGSNIDRLVNKQL